MKMAPSFTIIRRHQAAPALVALLVCLVVAPWASTPSGLLLQNPTPHTSQSHKGLNPLTIRSGHFKSTQTDNPLSPGSGVYSETFTTTAYLDGAPTKTPDAFSPCTS